MNSINPTLSIIIVHYHVEHELVDLLQSLGTSREQEIIVVDNDEKPFIEKQLTKQFPSVIYLKNKKNLGFGVANNIGSRVAKGKYLFFINPDTIVEKGTVEKLITFLDNHKKAGAVAPLLYHPDGTIFEKQGVKTLTPLRALFSTSLIHRIWPNNPIARMYWNASWKKKTVKEVGALPGTACMIRKELFDAVGGFDEKFFLYFEEFDLCQRINQGGLSLYMIPDTKVIHLWGVSTGQKDDKDLIFKESQEYYFRKYYGYVIAKILTTFLTFDKYSLLLLLLLLLGLFLRTYRITELFMFIGDFGWFYLSAWDMVTKGIIPLVSIPSSVVWLHQGPLATYMMAFALWAGRMNPVAPALLFSVIDMVTIYFVFLLGKKIRNVETGIVAALLYATSPLVLINVRMPYHTAIIPFFACSVILMTLLVLEKKRYYFWLFFLSGLLIQLELSNAIVMLIFMFLFIFYREEITLRVSIIRESVCGMLLGISPFILYDVTHHFTQTLGFPLWVLNRVRLFLGLTTSGNATTHNLPQVFVVLWEHIARIIFPYSEIIVAIVILLAVTIIGRKIVTTKKALLHNKSFILLLLWIIVPFVSFIVHAAPGDAYFPFLFPAIILGVAYAFSELSNNKRIFTLFVVVFLSVFNAGYTLSQDYFLSTETGAHYMPPHGYGFGPAFYIQNTVANKVTKDADGNSIRLRVGGYQGSVKTGGDQFKYLLMQKGVKLSSNASLTYTIYESKRDIPPNESVFYQNNYYFVTKTTNVNL